MILAIVSTQFQKEEEEAAVVSTENSVEILECLVINR